MSEGRTNVKKLAFIILIMIMAFIEWACSGTGQAIREDWNDFWNHSKQSESGRAIEQDSADFWTEAQQK